MRDFNAYYMYIVTCICVYNRSEIPLVSIPSTGMYVKGKDVTKLASMAKLKAGRLCRELSDCCLQYWGGMGYTSEVEVSR